ncbi:methyltransferase domain-containing protein [Brevundimonas sp.]|jgi:2-polyprenyl-3-methyl-5-hydroxy-6-metoxy-1,4-benzoquinol methylase|uniref:methyltransferase domain-containing protein n=1 Tax=Brevundimonas sp. TaxID=1871086 RepID=UPI0017A4C141|nr:methyltransferase domain-containing protein [Brevundimonas sp.]MBA4807528.1 methyltransferase domain-containing protein [Brevundimonas sp.]
MTLDALDQSSDADALVAAAERRLGAGDLNGAFTALKACLKQYPDHGPATAAMGLFLADHGDPATATHLLSRAMAAAPVGESRGRVAAGLAHLLSRLSPSSWAPQLDADLCACLADPAVEPQTLARVTAEALLLKQPAFDGSGEALEAMGRDPLWLAFLSRCLNVSAAMEARLDAVRAAVVETEDAEDESRAALICALALSGFASEYAAPVIETEGVTAILFRPPSPAEAAALGEGEMQALLVRRTIEEPARERALAEGAPSLTPDADTDAVSNAVRDQYEANPYPCWTAPPAPEPRVLGDVIAGLPGLDHGAFRQCARTVLTAGCGTGFEPIDLARMDPSLSITAMDLSRASLAYGMRVAEDLGLTGVRFVQGDILALDRVEARFDVVTSTGVIHHMAQPDQGLARLAGVLRPGGVVRLGLYSERGRALVRLAHDLIRQKGWTPVDADIRAFRAHVLALLEAEPLAALRQSDDFYSLSGCRDLVFHVQEHAYRPPELEELVTGAGLRLVGFDAPAEAQTAFRAAFGRADPLDLTLWDRLEQRQPNLFAGMYHLWAQKPA